MNKVKVFKWPSGMAQLISRFFFLIKKLHSLKRMRPIVDENAANSRFVQLIFLRRKYKVHMM